MTLSFQFLIFSQLIFGSAFAADYTDLIENRDFQIGSDARLIRNSDSYRSSAGTKDFDRSKSYVRYAMREGSTVLDGNVLYVLEVQKEKPSGQLSRISEFKRDTMVDNKYIPDWYTSNAFKDGKLISRTTCQAKTERKIFGLTTSQSANCVVVSPSFCKNLQQSLKRYSPNGSLAQLKGDLSSCGTHIKQLLDDDTFANLLKKDKPYMEAVEREKMALKDFQSKVVAGQSLVDSGSLAIYEGEHITENKAQFSSAWRYMYHLQNAIANCEVLQSKNPAAFEGKATDSLDVAAPKNGASAL